MKDRFLIFFRKNPANPKSIYAATTDGIFKSIDAGLNWLCILPIIMGEDIIIYPADTSQIVVSCGNLGSDSSGIYYSTDAGINWSKSASLPDFNGKTLLDTISAEEIWACTSCNACVTECPISIDPLSIIIDLRRNLVMENSAAPQELNLMMTNIENNGAPWQYNQMDRLNWKDE